MTQIHARSKRNRDTLLLQSEIVLEQCDDTQTWYNIKDDKTSVARFDVTVVLPNKSAALSSARKDHPF